MIARLIPLPLPLLLTLCEVSRSLLEDPTIPRAWKVGIRTYMNHLAPALEDLDPSFSHKNFLTEAGVSVPLLTPEPPQGP